MLTILTLVLADLPVHCMRSQVLGEWTLTVGPSSPTRSSCGHQRPDSQDAQPALEIKDGKEVHVTFADKGENKIVVQREGKPESYFSMVYDEGFEFNMDDNSYVAFSGFTLTPGPLGGKPTNQSECGRTQVGWYSSMDRSSFGCFYGVKKGFQPHALPEHKEEHKVVRKSEHKVDTDKPVSREEHEKKVALINENVKTWRATVYESYVGMSQRELNRKAGQFRPKEQQSAKSFLALSSHAERLALRRSMQIEAELPKSLDWRNVNGESFLEPTMDQGDCGSCYAVATMRMLNARHRIARGKEYNRTAELFSISFPLYCSEYNQGCQGGFSNLLSRWNQDVGLVPATCAPYTTAGTCAQYSHCEPQLQQWRADKHRYIGGYYGRANAGEMMLELQKGPIAVGIDVQNDFMYYMDGIYSGAKLVPIQESDGWQEMQHAVLLVGWGEEVVDGKTVKYWIIQNSWGQDWGEDGGFMRIKRGENNSGIESSPEVADVVVDESKGARLASFMSQSPKTTV